MLEILVAAAITVTGCQAPDWVADEAVAIGRAVPAKKVPPGNKAIQYCEYFVPQGADAVRVLYFDSQGEKIAEKRLAKATGSDASSVADDSLPEVNQKDFRLGEVREVGRSENGWTFRYRKNHDSQWRETTVGIQDLDVIDAGFDPYVREHWSQLSRGQEVAFGFASPVHGRVIRLRARSVSCQRADHARNHLCVKVDLAQPWLRWLAGDIYLVYSSDDRRLRYFDGVVNILDAGGDSQPLQIEYFYPSKPTS
ncbi:hypothetical protein [Microbulbifer sp.]|uniref:hypothetical protein n=1 Tax=Microbulbifer sp. TaxID=1908541 RepID=UPI002588B2B6|nr:hypothetical protein [Microbulbifer sp.]